MMGAEGAFALVGVALVVLAVIALLAVYGVGTSPRPGEGAPGYQGTGADRVHRRAGGGDRCCGRDRHGHR
jgi:hypothetical protein